MSQTVQPDLCLSAEKSSLMFQYRITSKLSEYFSPPNKKRKSRKIKYYYNKIEFREYSNVNNL